MVNRNDMLRKILFVCLLFLFCFAKAQIQDTIIENSTYLYGIGQENLTKHIGGSVILAIDINDLSETLILESGNYVFTSDVEIVFAPGFETVNGVNVESYISIPDFGNFSLQPKGVSGYQISSARYIKFEYVEKYSQKLHLEFKLVDKFLNNVSESVAFVGSDAVVLGSNIYTIDTKNLAKGYYILEIVDDKFEKWYLRLIK